MQSLPSTEETITWTLCLFLGYLLIKVCPYGFHSIFGSPGPQAIDNSEALSRIPGPGLDWTPTKTARPTRKDLTALIVEHGPLLAVRIDPHQPPYIVIGSGEYAKEILEKRHGNFRRILQYDELKPLLGAPQYEAIMTLFYF